MRSGGAAQKIMKRRGVLIALRAAVISSVALDLPCRTISVPIALFQSPLVPNPQPLAATFISHASEASALARGACRAGAR